MYIYTEYAGFLYTLYSTEHLQSISHLCQNIAELYVISCQVVLLGRLRQYIAQAARTADELATD